MQKLLQEQPPPPPTLVMQPPQPQPSPLWPPSPLHPPVQCAVDWFSRARRTLLRSTLRFTTPLGGAPFDGYMRSQRADPSSRPSRLSRRCPTVARLLHRPSSPLPLLLLLSRPTRSACNSCDNHCDNISQPTSRQTEQQQNRRQHPPHLRHPRPVTANSSSTN